MATRNAVDRRKAGSPRKTDGNASCRASEEMWDQAIARDSLAGRLDFLRDEVKAEKAAGTLGYL